MAFQFKKKDDCSVSSEIKKSIEIYIGLDFGTTFTKVSYQIGDKEGTTKYSIRFANNGDESDYCLSSKLWYDAKEHSLVFFNNLGDSRYEMIQYFKYSMIQKNVPRSENLECFELKNDPQRLCSAFYIANVLGYARQYVLMYLPSRMRDSNILWYVNMGVPVSDCMAKPKPIYDEVLNVAWGIVETNSLKDKMNLLEMDKLYCKWVDHKTWNNHLNTVPELYAEIVMFLQDKTVDSGFYAVVDIGGGTMDMAVFFKRIDRYTSNVEIKCVAQDVIPLGYEMYKYVHNQKESEHMCSSSYGHLIDKAYQNYRGDMQKAKDSRIQLTHFYMGGARNVPFYHNVIKGMWITHDHSWSCYPGSIEADIIVYMRQTNVNLEVDDNPRLIISQMLSQPFEKIPELEGQPWYFDKQPKYKNAPTYEDVMLSHYGDVE